MQKSIAYNIKIHKLFLIRGSQGKNDGVVTPAPPLSSKIDEKINKHHTKKEYETI